MRSSDRNGTIVVLTALAVEYDAVRQHLTALRRQAEKGTLFEVGWLDGTPWQVAVAELGEGNQAAAVITERAVAVFQPRAVVFVGVAGALKDDLRLGDVVVATIVHAYHGGKEENGEFLARPRSWAMDHELEQLARHVRRSPPAMAGAPGIHLKPIAAGEIVLNSAESPLREQLRRHYQDAVAIETESAGVASATHLNAGVPTMVVRGISDRADGGKRDADRAGLQEVAASNAAAVMFSILWELPAGLEDGISAGGSPPAAVGLVKPAAAPGASWCGGAEVRSGGRLYLLHEELLAAVPAADSALTVRQALARQLDPEPAPGGRYVWLRQVEAHPAVPPGAEAAARAMARENDLLARNRDRDLSLPGTGFLAVDARTVTLALPWPASRATGAPCRPLSAFLDEGGPFVAGGLFGLLAGLSRLCAGLEWLHRAGVAHRQLEPAGIIERDDGRLVLRDLGLAAHAPTPGEGPLPYRAPEQRRRARSGRPDAQTDVFQLAAVAYHLLTGHPPGTGTPLPLRAYRTDAPERADRVILAALAPEPSERPTTERLQTELWGAGQDLLQRGEG